MASELAGYQHIFQEPKVAGAPIFVTLHGTGGTEDDLLPLIGQLNQDAGILSPRGNVDENGHARFFKRHSEGVFDEEDIHTRAKQLVQFVNRAAEQYKFDRKELIWLGFSNGANMISSTMLLYPTVIQKAVLLRPMVTIIPNPLPSFADVSLLLAAGRADELVPMENTEKLVRLYQQCGALVELFQHDAGHHLTEADTVAIQSWLHRQH